MSNAATKPAGVAGLFDDADDILRAAKRVRDAGFRIWDCHTPYPVHGLDEAMGLDETPMPYITLTAGFIGLAAAVALTGGISVFQYPIHIGGKALWSWQAFVPIFFEFFVLFAACATMLAIVVLCRLGRWNSPLHDSDIMREITSDRFALVISADDPKYREPDARRLLEESGCRDVRALVELVDDGKIL